MKKLPHEKFGISAEEKEKYVLSIDKDYEILDKIHRLEKEKLFPEDKRMVKFIRTQLREDWRSPVIELLNEMLKKYKRSSNKSSKI